MELEENSAAAALTVSTESPGSVGILQRCGRVKEAFASLGSLFLHSALNSIMRCFRLQSAGESFKSIDDIESSGLDGRINKK